MVGPYYKDCQLEPPLPVSQILVNSSAKLGKITTYDVVGTYILNRLYYYCGVVAIRNYNITRYKSLRDHSFFAVIQEIEKSNMSDQFIRDLRKTILQSVPPTMPSFKAREKYYEQMKLGLFVDSDDACNENGHVSYNWPNIATSLAITAYLAEEAYGAGNEERIDELMIWITEFFKANNLDKWIQNHGGWEGLGMLAEDKRRTPAAAAAAAGTSYMASSCGGPSTSSGRCC